MRPPSNLGVVVEDISTAYATYSANSDPALHRHLIRINRVADRLRRVLLSSSTTPMYGNKKKCVKYVAKDKNAVGKNVSVQMRMNNSGWVKVKSRFRNWLMTLLAKSGIRTEVGTSMMLVVRLEKKIVCFFGC